MQRAQMNARLDGGLMRVRGVGAVWMDTVGVHSGAVCSFPAGKNNPTVVCCHGTSTKPSVLR